MAEECGTSKESEVGAQCKKLADLNVELCESIKTLTKKLEPAMGPPRPTPEVEKKEIPTLCPLAATLRAIAGALNRQIIGVRTLIDRFEI